MRRLQDILNSNHAARANRLPFVHTTAAYHMQRILESGKISPRECDVFIGERLSYFFVGRPAYKAIGRDAMHWELPSCIIMDFKSPTPLRIFPFDSGAYKRGYIPKYAAMHEMNDFLISNEADTIEKYIGTFFGTTDNYYKGRPIEKAEFLKRHAILPTETSIYAILSLIAGERVAKELDERRSAVECQFDSEIELTGGTARAVILPEVYLSDKEFIKSIEEDNIDIITYPIYPLNHDYFYFAIYDRCYQYFEKAGAF